MLTVVAACGLVSDSTPTFRTYPLPDVPYDEATLLVRETTRAFYRDRFAGAGGFTLDWEEASGNLRASPVVAGRRRLRLYAKVIREGEGSALELLALVEVLDEATPGLQNWVSPQKDVFLEEQLYEAILAERIRQQRG